MSIRTDVTVNWELSPRLITVAAPSVEISIQDLADTLRSLEHMPNPGYDVFSHDYIVDLAGKEDLGGGTTVGITATLNNARLSFEARTTPDQTGTATSIGTTTLADTSAAFVTNNIDRGAMLINYADGSIATVIEVIDENNLTHQALTGGTNNDWTIGDSYTVTSETQCNVSGGNLVAVDSVGTTIDPIFPTVGTQVVKSSSSSATLQSQRELENTTFIGKEGLLISIDPTNGTDSSEGLIGNAANPCKTEQNFDDIYVIRNISNARVISSMTWALTHNHGHTVFGANPQTVVITLDPAGSFPGFKFQDCYVQGQLTSSNELRECVVGAVTNANGFFYNSTLIGPIVISDDLSIQGNWNAPSVSDADVPIDFDGLAKSIQISGHQGGRFLVKNMVSGSKFFAFGEGHIEFDTSCNGGEWRLYGGFHYHDNSSGPWDIVHDHTIHHEVWAAPMADNQEPGSTGEALANDENSYAI